MGVSAVFHEGYEVRNGAGVDYALEIGVGAGGTEELAEAESSPETSLYFGVS